MRKITAVLGFALLSLSINANAALYLKSSGDQWGPAIQDLQNSFNEGVSSNKFDRFYNTLSSRFNLDGSSKEDILAAFKAGADVSSQPAFNGSLPTTGGGTVTPTSPGVSTDDFIKDRDSQNQHIEDVQKAAQAANEKGDAGAVRMDGIEKQAGVLDGRVGKTETRLDTVEGNVRDTNAQLEVTDKRSQSNAERIDGVEQVNDRQDKQIASKVDSSVFKADQQRQDEALAAETDSRVAGDAYVNSRVDAANANIEANRQASVATNKRVAANTAALANHEQRIQKLESETNSRFSNMDKRIDDNKQKADAAIAGVAAMANIPQVTESARFSVGAGLGTRGSQQAVAVGFSSRLSQNVVGKLSVAADTEQQWTAGVGMAVQW